jgi:hypothetical protein
LKYAKHLNPIMTAIWNRREVMGVKLQISDSTVGGAVEKGNIMYSKTFRQCKVDSSLSRNLGPDSSKSTAAFNWIVIHQKS